MSPPAAAGVAGADPLFFWGLYFMSSSTFTSVRAGLPGPDPEGGQPETALQEAGAPSGGIGPTRDHPSAGGPGGPTPPQGLHVAIIMDGNGRWAQARGLPRAEGHRAGSHAVRRVVAAAPSLGIRTLTLYAFSSDNWRRPPMEVRHLMRLLRNHLRSEGRRLVEEGVRVSVLGRRDRMEAPLIEAIEAVEAATREGARLHLQLAIDYSARDAIVGAIRLASGAADVIPLHGYRRPAEISGDDLAGLIARALHAERPLPDVDLLVRTGGEQRLSDFMLWEAAWAELVFTPRAWPDFGGEDLAAAVAEFHRRNRRFGSVACAAAQEVSNG